MPSTALSLRKALTTNSTATSFTAKTPTTTAPSGNGVFDLTDIQYGVGVDGRVPRYIQLNPFGGNASNDEFSFRVWGWSKTTDATPVWIPQLLLELAVVLGNISATAIAANMLLADTLTVVYGDPEEISPAGDLPASALIHLRGCERIEFDFDLTTGGDAANCYWRTMDQD